MCTATLTAVRLTAAPLRAAAPSPAAPSPAAPSPRATSVGSGRATPLVLTRRGRRLVRAALLGAVAVVLAAGLVLVWVAVAATVAPGASAGDGSPVVVSGADAGASTGSSPVVEVVVRPGDTLWALARDHAPGRDPRSVVDDIVRLNDLGSAGIQAGAVIQVPAG